MNKRQRNEKKEKNTHSKFTYNNLKRESKHLVIENVMDFINKIPNFREIKNIKNILEFEKQIKLK